MVQATGVNQSSHYALIRALDAGTSKIDRWHDETVDKSWYRGHYYSNKAPGLAFATTPFYAVTDAVGLIGEAREAGVRLRREAGGPPSTLREQRVIMWLLGLWAVLLPALALLVLVRSVAEREAPGYGTAAAVGVGAATLVMPYATMFYAHVPGAALAFASFVLARQGRFALAGLVGGVAALVEYPVGLIIAVIAIWVAVSGPDRTVATALRRGGRFAAGAILGLLPLAAYNLWAFGSALHMSYDDVVAVAGRTGHDVVGLHDEGLFGLGVPDPSAAWHLLLWPKGLLVLTPVVAIAAWGLWRMRSRVLMAIVAVAFLYNAGYYVPFGGYVPGPRFLVMMLPFLAVGLAVALRERTAMTLGLTAASTVAMVVATLVEPQLAGQGTSRWVDLLGEGNFQFTVASLAGAGDGWAGAVPFLALVAVSLALGARSLPAVAAGTWERGRVAGLASALAVLAGWALVALVFGDAPALVLAGALAGTGAAIWSVRRGVATARPPA